MRMRLRFLFFLGLICLCGSLLAQAPGAPGLSVPAQGASAPPKLGGMRGRVTASDTGAGLSKATLTLSSSEAQGRERPVTARTNLEGEYELKDVKPGRYYLRVNRNGYVMQAYGQKTPNPDPRTGALLTVRDGEILRQVDVKLIRSGLVEGRVVDADGEPMVEAQVMLERFVTQQGKRTLRPMGFGTTDDRGQFRIFGIAPGKYYVSARYQNWMEEGANSAYPPTYYPGTANPQEAARIDVVGGGQVSGIDIPLTETKAVSISGKVVRNDGKPAVQAMLMAMRIEKGGFMGFTRGMGVVDAEGNFKVGGMLPGRYRLIADARGSEKPQMASLVVEVGNEDIRHVVLSLGDGGEIAGKVVVEGGDTRSLSPGMRVVLESESGGMMNFRMQGGEVSDDLMFTLRDVGEGDYRFRLMPQPPNLYLKSARVQGKDALDQAFEIRNGEKITGAEIVLSGDGGSINGAVKQEENGETVKGATVVIFAAEASRRQPRSRWTRTTQSDQQGNYRLTGVEPGEYLICALQNHEAGAETSSDYLQALGKNAKSISVQPRSRLSESLVVAPVPAAE